MKQVEQFKKLETKKLPEELDYEAISGLRLSKTEIRRIPSGFCRSGVPELQGFLRQIFLSFLCTWNLIEEGEMEYMNYDLTLLENAVKEF